MQRILFETCCKARASCWGHSSFKTIKSFSEELICICPEILSCFIVNIFSFTLISALVDDISYYWILHCNTSQFSNVSSSGLIVLMRQPMRISEIGWFKAKGSGISIHLLDEIFHWLITRNSPLVNACIWSISTLTVCILVLLSWISIISPSTRAICRTILILVVFVSRSNFEKILTKMFC